MEKPILAILFIASLTPVVATVSRTPETPSDLNSLCNILSEPSKYSGATVRFRAEVRTDGFEYTTLLDPTCNQGVAPRFFSDDWEKHPKLKRFDDALESTKPGSKHPKIWAVFTGRFTYDPNNTNLTKRRVFEITDVDDLRVEK